MLKRVLLFSACFSAAVLFVSHEYSVGVLSPRALGFALLLIMLLSFVAWIWMFIRAPRKSGTPIQDAQKRMMWFLRVLILFLVIGLLSGLAQFGNGPRLPLIVGLGVNLSIMAKNIGQVIAERQLEVENSPSTKVVVRMGKPQPFPEGTSYFCPYQITAFGKERIFYAAGVDAFQAIELCLKMIAIDLAALSRDNGQRFRWGADDEGGWGFPYPEVFKD